MNTTEQAIAFINEFKVDRPKYRTMDLFIANKSGKTEQIVLAKVVGNTYKKWHGVRFDGNTYCFPSEAIANMIFKAITA